MGGGADSISEMSAPSSVYLAQSYPDVSEWTNITYIAPSDGYINVETVSGSMSSVATILLSSPTIKKSSLIGSNGGCYTYIPVVGGQTIYIGRGKYHTNMVVYFFYNIGSAKKLGLI